MDYEFWLPESSPEFLGANYADARDDYVYVYSPDTESAYDGGDRMVLGKAGAWRAGWRSSRRV